MWCVYVYLYIINILFPKSWWERIVYTKKKISYVIGFNSQWFEVGIVLSIEYGAEDEYGLIELLGKCENILNLFVKRRRNHRTVISFIDVDNF